MTPTTRRNIATLGLLLIILGVLYYMWYSGMEKGEKVVLTVIVLMAGFGVFVGHIKPIAES